MRSTGPSPRTWYAMCTPSTVFAYRVSGITSSSLRGVSPPRKRGRPARRPPALTELAADLGGAHRTTLMNSGGMLGHSLGCTIELDPCLHDALGEHHTP